MNFETFETFENFISLIIIIHFSIIINSKLSTFYSNKIINKKFKYDFFDLRIILKCVKNAKIIFKYWKSFFTMRKKYYVINIQSREIIIQI